MVNKKILFLLVIITLLLSTTVVTAATNDVITSLTAAGRIGDTIKDTFNWIKGFLRNITVVGYNIAFFLLIALFFFLLSLLIVIPLRFYDGLIRLKEAIIGFVSFSKFKEPPSSNYNQ